MAAYIHPEDYYNKVVDNKYSIHELFEYAYRGALLLTRERMGINDHHANNNCDNLKPLFIKEPKIEEVEDIQPKIEAGNQMCLINNFSGSNFTDDRDIVAITNIDPNSQKCFESKGSCELINSLEDPFKNKGIRIEKSSIEASSHKKRKRIESYTDISNSNLECKLTKGSPVSAHVEKMIGFIENLEKLGIPISQALAIGIIVGNLFDEYNSFIKNLVERHKALRTEIPKDLVVDIIIRSLPDNFSTFVMNFNMHHFDMSLSQLHGMINNVESNVENGKDHNSYVLMVQNKKAFNKKKKKGKAKVGVSTPTPAKTTPTQKKGPKGEDKCHYCKALGHWKRNCKNYLADKKNDTLPVGISKKENLTHE